MDFRRAWKSHSFWPIMHDIPTPAQQNNYVIISWTNNIITSYNSKNTRSPLHNYTNAYTHLSTGNQQNEGIRKQILNHSRQPSRHTCNIEYRAQSHVTVNITPLFIFGWELTFKQNMKTPTEIVISSLKQIMDTPKEDMTVYK